MLAHYRKRCQTVRREREIGGKRPLRLVLHDVGKAIADQFPGNRVQATGIAPGARLSRSSDELPEGPSTKIAPYAAQLIKALETDARRPKRDRRSALKLFGELQAAGFTGDCCRVTGSTRPPRISPARGSPLWEAAAAAEQAENDPQWDRAAQFAPGVEFDQRIAW